MVGSLNGIIFDQIYGDNTGGAEFDTDGDGTATQEDEFVSITNTTGAAIDVSGWEIWTDSTGMGAYGAAQEDGQYHVFPPGTVIAPGETLYIVTEYTGTTPGWVQEATAGGTESATTSTNFLSEGQSGTAQESIALVDPSTGDFLVFNMSSATSEFAAFDGGGSSSNTSLSGFPGTNLVDEIDGDAVQDDMNAGSSYQYDAVNDDYVYSTVFIPCFTAGTLIATPNGDRPIELLAPNDLVITLDRGPQPVRLVMTREVIFDETNATARPIEFKPGSLGPKEPKASLALSPQHRVVVDLPDGEEILCPAKALIDYPGVRVQRGRRKVTYVHLVLSHHAIVLANGARTETFLLGDYGSEQLHPRLRAHFATQAERARPNTPARRLVGVGQFQRLQRHRALGLLDQTDYL